MGAEEEVVPAQRDGPRSGPIERVQQCHGILARPRRQALSELILVIGESVRSRPAEIRGAT